MIAMSVLAAAAALGGIPGFSVAARATTAPYFTMTVTPTKDLTNGEAMTVTVERTQAGTAAGLEITSIGTGWCTVGFQAPSKVRFYPLTTHSVAALPTLTGTHEHCTTATHPLNADLESDSLLSPPYNSTDNYPTERATVTAETSEGTTVHAGTATLVCDAASPCTFVVAVFTKVGNTEETTVFLSVPVTFLPPSLSADCGGAAPGQLNTLGPDRIGEQVTKWTLGACEAGLGSGKALTGIVASAQSDSTALDAFADGSEDLVYSAVGYTATSNFTPPTERPFVAVPIAINAVVLAHLETDNIANAANFSTVFGNYPQLYITDAQAAELLGGGPTDKAILWDSALGRALVAENPTLGVGSYHPSTTDAITFNAAHSPSNQNSGIVAPSEPDAISFFATSFFHTVVPSSMTSVTGATLGVTSDFGTTQPPFAVVPATGDEIMDKDLRPAQGQGFALTDAATAAATWGGMAVFAIQTPGSIGATAPSFVIPTAASMDAAVSEMIPQPDGTLLPNPDATTVNGAVPYPLTYVEYAIAPAQPLLNTNCTPRTDSQQDLIDWLTYITGPGQSELTAGLEPLTPVLQAQARNAIAEVGKTPPTGACAPATAPAPTPTPSTSSAPASASVTPAPVTTTTAGVVSVGPSASVGFASTTRGRATATASKATTPKSSSPASSAERPVAVNLAGFKSSSRSSWLPVLGVLFLFLFLPGIALLVSGRPLRGLLSRTADDQGGRRGPPVRT